MREYELIAGLETHIELSTKTKIFAAVLLRSAVNLTHIAAQSALDFPARCQN